MSYTTITKASRDTELQDRVVAAAAKEAWAGGPEFSESEYGQRLRTYPQEALGTFMVIVAIDYEDEYEYALNNANASPGGDPGVITDAEIQACVQAHWPPSASTVPPEGMMSPTGLMAPVPGAP
jgi:hypothetical protein